MSQPSEDVTNHSIVSGESVSLPADMAALRMRMAYLSALPRPLFAERAELRSAIHLLLHGSVQAGDVWNALRDLYNVHFLINISTPLKDVPPGRLEPLHVDLVTIWHNLRLLADGKDVPTYWEPRPLLPGYPNQAEISAHHAWEAVQAERTKVWFWQLLHYAIQLDNDPVTYSSLLELISQPVVSTRR